MSFLQPQVKGSIPVGALVGGAAQVVSLPVGADGTVLTADSTTPSGLKYATPSGADIGVSVTNTTPQTIPTATTTTLTFNTEDWDTSGFHDNVVNNERLTVPVGLAGKYLVTLNVTFDPNPTGPRVLTINLNGAPSYVSDTRDATTAVGFGTVASISGYISLSVGDFITATVLQSSGGNLDVLSGRRLQMQKVG